jgi:dTDP-4-dehydrorhamnose 3,5-epimerase
MGDDWQLDGTTRDTQSITRDWQLIGQDLIHGVVVREVANVMTGYGRLTEIYRTEWDGSPVGQVFQSVLNPGGISAWHAHGETLDRLFINMGGMLVALYDARADSPTFGTLNVLRFGEHRPALVNVPPRVWHGVKNIGPAPAALVNVVDVGYAYEHPDHYRLPEDSPEVPFDIADAR